MKTFIKVNKWRGFENIDSEDEEGEMEDSNKVMLINVDEISYMESEIKKKDSQRRHVTCIHLKNSGYERVDCSLEQLITILTNDANVILEPHGNAH